jgi:uncharacterized SAM-binding protein YcdF (DUF218 family)
MTPGDFPCGYFCLNPNQKMRAALPLILAFFAILVVALLMLQEPILSRIGDYLAVKSQLQKAEIVHVISGPDTRTDYGIELVKAGYAPKIFFTGGWCSEINGYHGERGRQLALTQGLPESAITINDSKVTSTYDEALLLKAHLDKSSEPVRSIIVVSDPYHMRRVEWTYHRIFGKAIEIILAPVPFEKTQFKQKWWLHGESARNIGEEYLKLGYYILRYQLASGAFKDWLASLDVK